MRDLNSASNIKTPRCLFYEVGREQATHYIYSSVLGRTFLLPILSHGVNKSLAFFGVGWEIRLVTSLFRFTSRVRYVRVDLPDINLRGLQLSDCVIYIGTAGPYQKYTVYSRSMDNKTATVTKLSMTGSATHLIKNEAKVLGELAMLSQLDQRVPRLIDYGESHEVSWVRQVAGCGVQAKKGDYQVAMDFLHVLGSATESIATYSDSLCRSRLISQVKKLKPLLVTGWQQRCDQALNYLDLHATQPIRFVRAHRDFTRWNIKVNDERPFVFDWEYSEDGYPSSYDPLHFMLLSDAVKGKLNNTVIKTALEKITILCDINNDSSLKWHVLFYMFDLCLFYLESNSGSDDGDVVVQCYSGFIDDIISGRF
jgi:hypothetical protein